MKIEMKHLNLKKKLNSKQKTVEFRGMEITNFFLEKFKKMNENQRK